MQQDTNSAKEAQMSTTRLLENISTRTKLAILSGRKYQRAYPQEPWAD